MDARLSAYLELAAVPDEDFAERMYRLVLRRDPEPEARRRMLEKLADGTLSRATLLRELIESEEFQRVRALDDAVAFAAWARLHGERPRELRGPPESDERVIEIPWTLARYRGEARVLDVGYANAEPIYLAALLSLGARELVGADLVEAEVPGLRSVVADARDLPLEDGSLDVVFCISTLEHVGQDNRVYGVEGQTDEEGIATALRELRRVLTRRGRLLLTVPCGEPQEFGWFVQWDQPGWTRLFREAGFLSFEQEVYELGENGWGSTSASPRVRRSERSSGVTGVLCAELHPWRAGARLRQIVRGLRRSAGPRAPR